MNLKTVLRSGQFVTLIPLGLPMTLRYNAKGILEKVYRGYGEGKADITEGTFDALFHSKLVPSSISIKDGDTYVEGVLLSNKLYPGNGPCEDTWGDSIQNEVIVDIRNLHFAAGNAYSYAASTFRDINATRRWFKMSAFDVLPGFLVPAGLNELNLLKLVEAQINTCSPELKSYLNSKTPLISKYMVVSSGQASYIDSGLMQYSISRTSTYTDEYGALYVNVQAKDFSLKVPYSTAVKFMLRRGVNIILDSRKKLLYSYASDGDILKPYDTTIRCSWCGKLFAVGAFGDETICSDPHCLSRQYKDVQHMCVSLGVPHPNFEEYQKLCKEKQILWLPDLFELPQYQTTQVSCTLLELLDAAIPVFAVPNRSVLEMLSNRCSNNVETLRHYLSHPDRISMDLSIPSGTASRLVTWLSDSQNVSMVEALLSSPKIQVISTGLKFDGAPIFRNNIIMITGKFAHGSKDDVRNILESYAATVVYHYDDTVQCVLVGDAMEDVDGQSVRKAQWNHVPVMNESDFFAKYDIDTDLAENGLL